MSVIEDHPQSYVLGQLSIEKDSEKRFTLKGNWAVAIRGTHHMQLIYEALEIAAASDDLYALSYRAMCDELIKLTESWVD